MKKLQSVLNGFSAAWDLLIDFPLPKWYIQRYHTPVTEEYIAAGLSLVGIVLGLIPVMIGKLGCWFFNPVAGAFFFALSGTALLLLKDSGRGASLLASWLFLRFSGIPAQEASKNMVSSPSQMLQMPQLAMPFALGIVLLAAVLFLLGYFHVMGTFLAVTAADSLLQARLMLENSDSTGIPRLELPEEKRRCLWLPAEILGVLLILAYPRLGMFAGIAIIAAICRFLPERLDPEYNGLSGNTITLAGFALGLFSAVWSLTVI